MAFKFPIWPMAAGRWPLWAAAHWRPRAPSVFGRNPWLVATHDVKKFASVDEKRLLVPSPRSRLAGRCQRTI